MSRPARVAWFLLGIDLFLFVLETVLGWAGVSYGRSLGGWVSFLSFVVIILFLVLGYRYTKSKLLWRLRNRLIVTYVFIGVFGGAAGGDVVHHSLPVRGAVCQLPRHL